MAERLLDAGHDLVVWNRSPEKAKSLVDSGATLATDPAAAVGGVEAAITMLADPSALRAVSEGTEGFARAIDRATTVIEMSTVGPAAIRRLARQLPEGAGLLDAPVLGSLSEVEAGSLKIFVGGPAALFERWRGLFDQLGEPLHVGPVGSGAAAKLVANTTLFGTLGVLGEAVALADALGIPRDETFAVLSATPLGAQAERRRPAIETGESAIRFGLGLALKDLELIAQAGGDHAAELRLTDAARSWFADAVATGLGERDYSAILAYITSRRRPAD